MIDIAEYTDRVSRPGKYEGEHPIVPFLWEEVVGNGDGDLLWADSDGSSATLVEIQDEEREAFDVSARFCLLTSRSDGFIVGEMLTGEEAEEYREEEEKFMSLFDTEYYDFVY